MDWTNEGGRTAVIIPCYNEEIAIGKVVREAQRYLPNAEIFVFDNNSKDATVERARAAGAHVIHSPRQGKGHVVRHAFRILDADYYLLIDGDDTYPLEEVDRLFDAVVHQDAAMAIGTRLTQHQEGSFRKYHVTGNRIFSNLVSALFHQRIDDMLSGYRLLRRDFVDQIRLQSTGFEIETDLTLQAISKNFPIKEVPVSYRARPAGSHSKLNTYRDGFFIMKFILMVVKDYRPLPFFSAASLTCFLLSLWSGYQPVMDYIEHSYVYTVPRAILAASLMLMLFMFVGIGLVLDSQIRAFNDQLVILHRLLSRRDNKTQIKKAG
jgi:glycosyltransferase involved in cell wall biosynthesis